MLTRRLGGGRFAQALAALAILVAPVFLAFSSYLSMNPVEPLIWTGCAFLLLRLIQTGDTRLWLPFGLLSGIGILNKHTMLLFGFALVVGPAAHARATTALLPLAAPRRPAWRSSIILPHLVWQIRHGFPQFEVLANIRRDGRDVSVGFLQFWQLELLFLNPAAAPVWLAGLVALFAAAASGARASSAGPS